LEETLGKRNDGPLEIARRWTKVVLCALGSLMSVTFVIGLVAYPAIESAAFFAKAKADVRTLASAIEYYRAHMGAPPASLSDLLSPATNARGQTEGPYMGSIPWPATGFSKYEYVRDTDGRWSIFTSGRDFCGVAQRVEASAGSLQPSNRFCKIFPGG
jgi:hypothetical protein